MQLRLTVTRRDGTPPSVPLAATFDAHGGSIGRHPGNDLELPDRSMEVSRKHAAIELRGDTFFVTDSSRNGLLLNGVILGTGNSAPIAHGDRLVAGGYEIEAAIEANPAGKPIHEVDSKALDDPFAEQAAPDPGAEFEKTRPGMSLRACLAGDDEPRDVLDVLEERSPLSPSKAGDAAPPAGDFRLREDRSPAHAESLPSMRESAPAAPEAAPAHDAPVSSEAASIPPSSEKALPTDWKLRSNEPEEEARAEPLSESPLAAPADEDVGRSPPPAAPETQGRGEVAAETPTALDDRLLEAFLEGVALKDFAVDHDDAAAILELAGRILRETVRGVRRVLVARSTIKDTFRLPVTRLQQIENNPLKFSVGVEDALEKLLDPSPKGYLPPVDSVREVFEDLEIHEIAVINGMRAALGRVLTRFEPGALEKRLESHFLESVVPAARKARLWEMFTEQYDSLHREAKDAFEQLYGREFAEAYETEIRTLKAQRVRAREHVAPPSAATNPGPAKGDES